MAPRRALALLALVPCAHALYFYLPEGSSKCFMEEVPPETLFVGSYKNPDFVPFGSTGFTGSVCVAAGGSRWWWAAGIPAPVQAGIGPAARLSTARRVVSQAPI